MDAALLEALREKETADEAHVIDLYSIFHGLRFPVQILKRTGEGGGGVRDFVHIIKYGKV